MRTYLHIPVLLAVFCAVSTTPLVHPVHAVAAPKKAECTVCREGEEPVKATAKHEGKEFYFCSAGCRDMFLKDPAKYAKSEAPGPAPAFSLKDLGGKTVSLADYKGKVVLLDFWATFCAPCVKAMPKLQKLHEQNAAKGFAVIGIATDEEGEKVVRPMVARTRVSYPILLDGAATWKAYGVATLPALFLVDRSGQIIQRFGGAADHKTIEAAVARALGA
jgi:peroxiredoxin